MKNTSWKRIKKSIDQKEKKNEKEIGGRLKVKKGEGKGRIKKVERTMNIHHSIFSFTLLNIFLLVSIKGVLERVLWNVFCGEIEKL